LPINTRKAKPRLANDSSAGGCSTEFKAAKVANSNDTGSINDSRPTGWESFFNDSSRELLEVKYGLLPEVQFCRSCVLSNHRVPPSRSLEDTPKSVKTTVRFNDDGLCDAGSVVANKTEIGWEERERALIDLIDTGRSRNGSYDCLVPGSGGKDSIYAKYLSFNDQMLGEYLNAWGDAEGAQMLKNQTHVCDLGEEWQVSAKI
jgi:hypothetical protein